MFLKTAPYFLRYFYTGNKDFFFIQIENLDTYAA